MPREGPEELASLADSFNQMAMSLEEQQRVRRDFIANAAHELRTPLTNLKGYLEALRDGVVPADAATFESLLEEADRLVRLSRSLDTLAEGDAATAPPEVVEVDVAMAVRSAVDLARPAFARASLVLDVDVPASLPARANPDHLAQVLANLLQNALRYTPPGGRVTIHGERRPNDVLIAIVNTGDGIPAADLPRVFERFYRVDKSRDRAQWWRRHRPRDRPAARRGGRRTGRGGVRQRNDALLVQPAAPVGDGRLRTRTGEGENR